MRNLLALSICAVLLTGGGQSRAESDDRKSAMPRPSDARHRITQVSIKYETGNPNIGITGYTLISPNAEAQRADAEAVMRVKKNFPLAVQTKDRALFEKILARDFVFRGESGMLDREDYINDRTNPSRGKVLTADYENIALQFFAEIAVMTYRNLVKSTDSKGQPDPPEYISWADIYVRENGEWKIGSVHVVDVRTEKAKSPP